MPFNRMSSAATLAFPAPSGVSASDEIFIRNQINFMWNSRTSLGRLSWKEI